MTERDNNNHDDKDDDNQNNDINDDDSVVVVAAAADIQSRSLNRLGGSTKPLTCNTCYLQRP